TMHRSGDSTRRLFRRNPFARAFRATLKNVWHTLTRRTWPARVGREFLRPVLRNEPREMYAMSRRYRPKPYNGRVVLFRRSLRAIQQYLDRKLGWGGVITGELDVVEIEGGHDDMFKEPGVQRTAAALTVYLRDHPQGQHQCATNWRHLL